MSSVARPCFLPSPRKRGEKEERKIIYPRSKNLTDNARNLFIEGRTHEAS
jgi:hypothetical protein